MIKDKSYIMNEKLLFDTMFFNSPYGVVILDKDLKVVKINNNFNNLFQFSLEEIIGESLVHLVLSPESKTQIDNNIHLIFQGKIIKQEGQRKRKDGKIIDVEILGYPIIQEQSMIGAYVIYIDISDKKEYERQLLLFRKVLENNTEGVIITDYIGRFMWINKAFEEITGYTLDEIYGKNISFLKSDATNQGFYANIWKQLQIDGSWSGEIWNRNKKGDIYPEWLSISSINSDSNETTHYVGIFKDLSEKKQIDRRMNDLQQRDSLTGLHNRNYFLQMVDAHIKKCCQTSEKFSVIYIDLEGLKEINVSLGHALGDKLLIELSNRLQRLINDDFILSRFNGDEFVILFKSVIEESDVICFAKILSDYIKQPFIIHNTMLHMNANIGISCFPEDGVDAETLVRYADIAMSKARDQTEEKICYYTKEMSIDIDEKFILANQLVDAIPNNEFAVYYQPIIEINQQDRIAGAEALLRWHNQNLGFVSPSAFIPVAEKTGQIISIGEWVIKQVCLQIIDWQNKGYNVVPISINISVKQLELIDFASIVIQIIKKNNINPSLIELEITESVSSGDIVTIIKNLKELKMSGIKISMDDFGTGFSSIAQLDLFELDKLKIDKSLIEDLRNIVKRQKLINSIIAMAGSLDLLVVAEGIETKEQLSYLKEIGCQLGQGYIFSKPVPAEEIEKMLG